MKVEVKFSRRTMRKKGVVIKISKCSQNYYLFMLNVLCKIGPFTIKKTQENG